MTAKSPHDAEHAKCSSSSSKSRSFRRVHAPRRTLPYDVLFNIVSFMQWGCSKSLVNLACTSRKMRDLVIPRFLYSHITPRYKEDLEGLLQLFRRNSASYSDSVRSFLINTVVSPSAQRLLIEALPKMRNMREIRLPDASKFTKKQAVAAIGAMNHLRCLHILHFTFSTFDRAMENLTELRSLRLEGSRYDSRRLSPRWGGKAISNSRETLEQLCLGYVSWDLRMGPVGIWPRLHTLDLRDAYVLGMEALDLSASFPSVRSFGPPFNDARSWAPLPCNLPFLSRLESFQGGFEVLEIARPNFAALRTLLAQHWEDQPITRCDHFLPPSLQSLQLELYTEGTIVPQTFGALADAAPNLTSLSIYWHVALTHHHAVEIAEALIAFLLRLPLAYVKIECCSVTYSPQDMEAGPAPYPELHSSWERIADLALSLNAIKAFDLHIGYYSRRQNVEGDIEPVDRTHLPVAMHTGYIP